jgi:hypothetical protein
MKSNFKISILFLSLLLLAACSNSTKKTNGATAKDEPQMVGSDRDDHGCIGSAGYQWSVLKNECVRLFEVGTRLDPKGDGMDMTLSAFVVFKAPGDDAQAEIFVPGQAASILLSKSGTGAWKGKAYSLKLGQGLYTLTDGSGKTLYQGASN